MKCPENWTGPGEDRGQLFLVLRTLRRAREKNLQILELKQIDEREIDDDMD